MIKDTIPNCIQDELHYSQEDISSFEEFKRTVLQIDNNYWKRIQDDKNKSQTTCFFQYHISKLPKSEFIKTSSLKEKTLSFSSPFRASSSLLLQKPPTNNILGANSQLILVEQQCHMNLGLYLYCDQSRHLARLYPRQSMRSSSSLRVL